MTNSLINEVTWERLMDSTRDPLCELGYGAQHKSLPNVYGQVAFNLDREQWSAEVWAVHVVDGYEIACDSTMMVWVNSREEAKTTVECALADVAAGLITMVK